VSTAQTPVAAAAASSAVPRTPIRAAGLLLAVAALLLVCLISLAVGARAIDPAAVWGLLLHDDGSEAAFVVRDLRIPRTVLGVLAGVALGLAGALMQALTRNPLADPGLLGVEIGASTAVVAAISFLGITTAGGYVWFALAGAAATSVAVYLLGSAGRAAAPERMVLAGAAISAALGAFVAAVLLLDTHAFDRFRFWAIGSLAGRDLAVAAEVGPFVLIGVVIAVALAGPLNALALGDDTGRALGARIGTTRAAGALAVALLCGAATAAVGPIGFVGLTVPHVARMMAGPDHRWVLPYSAVLAPVLVVGADVVGRVVVAPGELEVGIVMAFVGAPVFIALCRRRRIAQL
jgi:iron complex transport system permease protein